MKSALQFAVCFCLATFASVMQAHSATLVAEWNFSPTNRAGDASGNGNSLTNLSGVTSYSVGPNGYVAANIANGGGNIVDRTSGLNNFTGLGSVTYSAWMNITNPANGSVYQGIITQDTASVPVGERILVNPSGNLYINTGTDHDDKSTNIAVATGWHQVVMTVADAGPGVRDTLLYLDGTLRDTIVQTTGNLPNASTWSTWLGMGEQGTQWPLQAGALADVRVYQGALTADQVTALFNAVVPEPSSIILSSFGVIGLLVAARRRRKA